MKHVGKNIRKLRLRQGWNQQYVANRLNISIPAFSKIETGYTDINLSRLSELANVFGVGILEIIRSPEEEICNSVEMELKKCKETLMFKELEISELQRKIIQLFDELRLSQKTN
jgi:transcriptional regulator with XRE-family HTH domain